MTHHFVDVGHGSKVFRKIYNVVDGDGCLIGNVSLDPYSDAINKNTVIFKAENNILYEPDAIPRIFTFLAEAGLRYKGITRIDVAYDCNEFYGGLKPQKLLDNYFNMKYLKLGNNDPWVKMAGGYKLKFRANNSQKIKLDGDGQTVGAFRASSVTWGQRSSDIQVQVYNKSKELREVKMKHHIVDWWKQNGLDTEKQTFTALKYVLRTRRPSRTPPTGNFSDSKPPTCCCRNKSKTSSPPLPPNISGFTTGGTFPTSSACRRYRYSAMERNPC